jgi:Na+-translocating ferredoxin:NAD+ oxidoreductase subunit B
MQGDSYTKLREFLNQFPLGFPSSGSGIEIEILKKLFTEEEAELAVLLTPFPEEAEQIASRTGVNGEVFKEKLESMAKKGLIFRARRDGKTFFNSAPFMIGLYEYSVKNMDRELAELYARYYEKSYQEEMGASDVPGFRVFPVSESINPEITIFPYPALEIEIRAAREISVAECICRKEAGMTGKGCKYPIETCLHFGAAAEYYAENGIGRKIDAEEAINIVKAADNAGLVHAGVNTRHLSNLCNCCPCCCASMKGITQKGLARRKFLNPLYEAFIDSDACTGCGICPDRCPVGAVSLDDTASVNRDLCLGCGLCAGTCPNGAISLRPKTDREEPFERVIDLGMAILAGKAKAGG